MTTSKRPLVSRKNIGSILAVAVMGVSLLAPVARAATYTWAAGSFAAGTYNFVTPANWGGAGYPGSTATTDIANITGGVVTGVVQVNLQSSLSGALGTLNLSTAAGSSVNATANLTMTVSTLPTVSLGVLNLTSGSATVGRVAFTNTATGGSVATGAVTLNNANLTAGTGSIIAITGALANSANDTS